MAARRRSPPSPPSSVARSLAAAAAALRNAEWQRSDAWRQAPVNGGRDAYAPHNPQQRYDRDAFYEELRARHRDLTLRQRRARERYEWTNVDRAAQEDNNGAEDKHSRIVDAPRQEAVRAPPVTQLVASLVPRVNAERSGDRDNQVPQTRSRTVPPVRAATRSKSPGSSSKSSVMSNRSQKRPAMVEGDAEEENEASVVEDEEEKKPKKRVRYLRDTDRRNIIKRIENGEKQAALAREFGVTRAAICHIKKNKFEILSRYNMLVKSAQEMDIAENFAGPPGVEMMVHEVRANSVLLLLTMMRDNRSNGATFRRVAGRLIMILLEEALAIVGTQPVDVITGTGHVFRGLEHQHPFCGVGLGAEGFPFLVLFHQMEPEAPQGSIHIEMTVDRRGSQTWHLDHMDLPANIAQHKVLLFSSTCSTGEAECKAIDALRSVGCAENSIMLVVILVAADGVAKISELYPQVKIVAGAIDGKVDRYTNSIIPGFGDFVSRYNSA